MDTWILLWKTILIIGIGSFYLLVLFVIPLGARDIKRMFADLDQRNTGRDKGRDSP